MIKRFICWVLGHKIVTREYTGFYRYAYVRHPFCLRCGVQSASNTSAGGGEVKGSPVHLTHWMSLPPPPTQEKRDDTD